MSVSSLARIPDRFSQHRVKLALAEFLRVPPSGLPRHLLCHRARTGDQQRRPSLRHRPYLGICRGRLVTTLQAQTRQLGADRVAAIPQTTRDLRRALSYGPEFFEQCYVFRIPTHERYYTPIANDRLVVSRIAIRHHGAGVPALLTPLLRAENLVVNTTDGIASHCLGQIGFRVRRLITAHLPIGPVLEIADRELLEEWIGIDEPFTRCAAGRVGARHE
jgi:hypothetical protein